MRNFSRERHLPSLRHLLLLQGDRQEGARVSHSRQTDELDDKEGEIQPNLPPLIQHRILNKEKRNSLFLLQFNALLHLLLLLLPPCTRIHFLLLLLHRLLIFRRLRLVLPLLGGAALLGLLAVFWRTLLLVLICQ